MIKEFKIGDKVKVMRQIGKDGVPELATGVIDGFSDVITIGGEKTAIIKYDDGNSPYWHPLSKIELA